MKALVMYGPGNYEITDVPDAVNKDDEVLIKVKSVAICGSDPPLLNGESLSDGLPGQLPFIPGHEGAGEIVAVGSQVRGYQVGDRVAIESHLGCGYCANCKAGRYNLCLHFGDLDAGHKQYGFTVMGCYAEYMACKPRVLHKIPDNLTYDHGALTDTVSTAFHAIEQAGIVSGGWSVILGCGPVGSAALMLCRALGSKTIVIDTGDRLDLAKQFGADVCIDFMKEDTLEKIFQATDGLGAERAFDCAGNRSSLDVVLRATRRGGTACLIAIPKNPLVEIDVKTIVWDEKKFVGSRGNPNCHDQVLSMMSKGMIRAEEMISHHFPLEQFEEALRVFVNHEDGVMKVIITIGD